MTRRHPNSWSDCLRMDDTDYLTAPAGVGRVLIQLKLDRRLSMRFWLRLAQYFHQKSLLSSGYGVKYYRLLALWAQSHNKTTNAFEHSINPHIEAGINFHHIGVCITSGATIERGVHIGRNVTIGSRRSMAPLIRKNAYISSHSIILGGVTVGEGSIVAPGAVVISDVMDGKIAGGVPARIIGDVTERNYEV